jgi:hypothetical protein
MATDLIPPIVPNLDAFSVLDLDALGGADLITKIQLQNAPLGHWVHPNWRGTTVDGRAVDSTEPVQIFSPDALLNVPISYIDLQAIDQGHALYSYTLQREQIPEPGYEESRRVALLVGARNFPGAGLSVAVIKEAHELQFDRTNLSGAGATVAIAPWQAMRVGDRLTLSWQGVRTSGALVPVYQVLHELREEELGKPLALSIPYAQFALIAAGHGLLNYWINYADGGEDTVAPTQRFSILPAPPERLAPVAIVGHSGDILDPGLVAAQLTFSIERYEGLRDGDSLVVYAEDPATQVSQLVASVRLDRSSVDSGLLHCKVQAFWLWDYLGGDVSLTCHVARPGLAWSSEPRLLHVCEAMKLPMPVVEGASGAGEEQGEFKALSTRDGVKVWVPSGAVYPGYAGLEMHWVGFGETGSYIARTSTGDTPPAFLIDPAVVAPNMGKQVRVFYRVSLPGEPARDSQVFTVTVLPIPESSYPPLVCVEASNGVLSLAGLRDHGSTQTVAPWPLIAEGQCIDIVATGTRNGGPATHYSLLENKEISSIETTTGVTAQLPKSWLSTLQLRTEITFVVKVSADGGQSYATFPRVYITLVA